MRFSIITICLNEKYRLTKTIRSVMDQSFIDFEYIIQDGGSTDGSLDIIQNELSIYGRNRVIINSLPDDGLYDAMNKAAQIANGEYILFLNAGDVIYNRDTLSYVDSFIKKYPDRDIYYGDALITFPDGTERSQTNSCIETRLKENFEGTMSMAGFGIIHQAIYASKRSIKEKPFDTVYRLRAELNWYYDCIMSKYKMCKIDAIVCRYDSEGISYKADSIRRSYEETCRIIEAHGFDSSNYKNVVGGRISFDILHQILTDLLALRIRGVSISDYLKKNDLKKIAIYGYAEIARHIIAELRNTEYDICSLIDKRHLKNTSGIRVISPFELDEEMDADIIIVTAVSYFDSVKAMYSKFGNKVVSIEEIIAEMWTYVTD